MTIEDMFTKLWFAYPSDLCRNKRGGKQPALQAFKKLNPDQDEFDRILRNMDAQIRMDRKDKDAYRWPFVSTYLNQRRYDDVIESIQTVEKRPETECCVDNCHSPVHGPSFNQCSFHLPNNFDVRLRQGWKETGLCRKSPTLAQDCREYCKSKGYLI